MLWCYKIPFILQLHESPHLGFELVTFRSLAQILIQVEWEKKAQHTGPNLLESTRRGAAMSPNNSHIILGIVTPWKNSHPEPVASCPPLISSNQTLYYALCQDLAPRLSNPGSTLREYLSHDGSHHCFKPCPLGIGQKYRNVLVRHFKVNIVLWDVKKMLVDWWGGQTFGHIVYGSILKPRRGDSDWNLTPTQLGFE